MDTPKNGAGQPALVNNPLKSKSSPLPPEVRIMEPLTRREGDVLRQVAQGLSNPEIAHQLFISLGTVRTYLNSIYGKLQILGPFRRGKLIRYGLELAESAQDKKKRPKRQKTPI